MTTKTSTLIEAITKHPQVSRVYANAPKIELLTDDLGLQALCRLRRTRRNAKQCIQNFRDEQAHGVTYEQGGLARAPKVPHRLDLLLTAWEHRDNFEASLIEAVAAALTHLGHGDPAHVQAVNSHDQLVEALRELIDKLKVMSGCGEENLPGGSEEYPEFAKAEAALAKAKGE